MNTVLTPVVDDGFRTVFQRNPTPMWVFELATHRFLAVNAAAVEEYGYPPDKFLTLTMRDVHGDVDIERFDQALAKGAQDLYSGLWVHRRRDGTSLHVEIRSNDLLFQGRMARLIHATNVTSRLQADASRRESEQLLSAIIESSDDAILSKSPDSTILTWNAAAERMYGYTAAEAIGESVQIIVPPEAREELAATLELVGRGERITPYETIRMHKDGRKLSVYVAISPIVSRTGAVVGISSIARDITQRKAMELQLRQTQKMEAMGSLAGGIAHDFNNLLTVILGHADLACESLDPGSVPFKDIEEIRMAGFSATVLTRQLLTFSRKGVVQDSVGDLNEIVARLDRMLRRTLGEDVDFIVDQNPGPCNVRADQGQIEQVLMNLVVNARDAMPDGGLLRIQTRYVQINEAFVATHPGAMAGAFVKLSVTDTGGGMTPEVLAQILEPFFTTKGPTKGTGLGLSTVRDVVEQAGGFMLIETQPGVGSTFSLYLPHVADLDQQVSRHIVTPVTGGNETILLVEDDNNIRMLSARGLRRHGYTVLVARHAGDAVRVATGFDASIQLLLTDIVMPGANGRALAEELTKSIRGLKVLYTSGYTDSVATLHAIRASSAQFIQKPYSPDTLARKVRQVIDA